MRRYSHHRAAGSGRFLESNSPGLSLVCECLQRSRAHVRNNHERKWQVFVLSMQDQVSLASPSGGCDSLKIQFSGKVGVPLALAPYFAPDLPHVF